MTTTQAQITRPCTYETGSDYEVASVALERLRLTFERAAILAKDLDDKVRMYRASNWAREMLQDLRTRLSDYDEAVKYGGTPDPPRCETCGAALPVNIPDHHEG